MQFANIERIAEDVRQCRTIEPRLIGAEDVPLIGQLVGAIVMVLCGLVPGYLFAMLFKMMGILRTSEAAELEGMDPRKVPAHAYPEGIPASPVREAPAAAE